MAKKKEKDNEENSGKSNKGMMIVLFVLGLIVLGASAFGGMYLFMRTNNAEPKEVIIEQKYVDLEEFTINLGDKGGKKFFKGELALGYDKEDKKIETELTESTVVIRDAIIFYFKSQQSEYINDVTNKDKIKEELIEAINKELQKGKITDIRFKNMIVQ